MLRKLPNTRNMLPNFSGSKRNILYIAASLSLENILLSEVSECKVSFSELRVTRKRLLNIFILGYIIFFYISLICLFIQCITNKGKN